LMYLARAVHTDGQSYPMSDVLPIEIEIMPRPQGHGYCEVAVAAKNPFFPVGTVMRGHEFHYSRVIRAADRVAFAYRVNRGTGCGLASDGQPRDGMMAGNVLASYTHLHADGVAGWADNLCRCARANRPT